MRDDNKGGESWMELFTSKSTTKFMVLDTFVVDIVVIVSALAVFLHFPETFYDDNDKNKIIFV